MSKKKEDLEAEVQRLLAMNAKTVDTKTDAVKPAAPMDNNKSNKSGDESTPLLEPEDGAPKKPWYACCTFSCGNPLSACGNPLSACGSCLGSVQSTLGVMGSWIAGALVALLVVYLCLTFLIPPGDHGDKPLKFEPAHATSMAAMASAAYRPIDKITSWTCEPCHKAHPQPEEVSVTQVDEADGLFYTAKIKTDEYPDGALVLVIRGTMLESARTWESDLDFFYMKTTGIGKHTNDHFGRKKDVSWLPTKVDVHPGFFKLYQLYQKKIIRTAAEDTYLVQNQGYPVIVVGHSLGGALATYAAYDLYASGFNVREVWTFGSPRVGSEAFASAYAQALSHRTWRVVNNNDKVPHVPHYPMYHHVPAELWCKNDDGSCKKYESGDGTGEDWSLSGHYHFAGMPIKSLVDHNRGMGIPFDGAPTFTEVALLTTFKNGLFTKDFDLIVGPFDDPCEIREDKDVCEAEKAEFIETKKRANAWATANEQNALQKLMKRKSHSPSPPPPSPPPGQLEFMGVDTGYMPEAEKYGEAKYGK